MGQREGGLALAFVWRAAAHQPGARYQSALRLEESAVTRTGISYADPGKQNYVSLSGTAKLVRDAATIREHWSELLRTWFPGGRDDPEVALLRVDIQQAEYWDAPSFAMVHAFGYGRAMLTGTSPHPGDNRKLSYS